MTVGFVATHYPHPDHHDAFVSRVHRVAEALRSTPGCLSAECWVTAAGDAVVSIARWESEAAQAASMQALGSADVDVAFDEREVRPREIVQLVSA
ncbi:antibiotic biosynthesis monooxygenase [Amycolatopsis orientalis]|uniref:antibiotic biosynthesis monooxygenase n=1 Tax=Amycolatopsis orientalis TaxID=31958 RepID=UPI00042497BC|nr:antibiotic biosynthesis monooxygenase [Amycolatopsis orientalis]